MSAIGEMIGAMMGGLLMTAALSLMWFGFIWLAVEGLKLTGALP